MEIPIVTGRGKSRRSFLRGQNRRIKGYKADELDTSMDKTDIPAVKGYITNKEDESLYQSQWTVKWEENKAEWRGTDFHYFQWLVLPIIVIDVVFRHKHVEPPKPGEELS